MTSPILTPPTTAIEHAGYTAEFVMVTPEIAAEYLGQNIKNRNLRDREVAKIARDMQRGRFLFTGDTIKKDINGKVLDGQHRLWAIVTSGIPQMLLVVSGLDPTVQDVVDAGAKRTAADMLAMRDMAAAPTVSAAATLALCWNAGYIKTATTNEFLASTHSEISDFVESDPWIEWAVDQSRKSKKLVASRSAVAFAYWLCGRVDATAAVEFFDDVWAIRTDGPGDPRHTLFRRLDSIKAGRERTNRVQIAYYMVRAFNAWRAGEKLSNLKVGNTQGPFKFLEPI